MSLNKMKNITDMLVEFSLHQYPFKHYIISWSTTSELYFTAVSIQIHKRVIEKLSEIVLDDVLKSI